MDILAASQVQDIGWPIIDTKGAGDGEENFQWSVQVSLSIRN